MSNEDAPRQTTMCPRYKAQVNGDATGKLVICHLSADLTLALMTDVQDVETFSKMSHWLVEAL